MYSEYRTTMNAVKFEFGVQPDKIIFSTSSVVNGGDSGSGGGNGGGSGGGGGGGGNGGGSK